MVARKYLFADESGNFDFRDHHRYPGASRYFAVGTAMLDSEVQMLSLRRSLSDLRHELAWNGVSHDGAFHAAQDKQAVRNAVLDVLAASDAQIDVTILEKSKARPDLYAADSRFYKYAWFYHFKFLAPRYFHKDDELLIVSASLGTKKKKRAFTTAVDDVVTQCLDHRVKRQTVCWSADSEPCLQAADYGVWAVMRDVDGGDDRSRKVVDAQVRHVFDLFSIGKTHHYGPLSKAP
jgi:hypothetical protein